MRRLRTSPLAVPMIGVLGGGVGGERVGVIAAGLAAVYPALVMLDSSLRSESLYLPLIALCLLACYRLVDAPRGWGAGLLGLAIGLAALTRSEGAFLPPALAAPGLWLLARGRG